MSVERSPKLIAPYLAVYLFVIGLTFYLTVNYWPQTNIGSMKKVRIDHGITLSNISDKLNKKGIITNKWVFEFLIKIKEVLYKVISHPFVDKNLNYISFSIILIFLIFVRLQNPEFVKSISNISFDSYQKIFKYNNKQDDIVIVDIDPKSFALA